MFFFPLFYLYCDWEQGSLRDYEKENECIFLLIQSEYKMIPGVSDRDWK